jgi:hypothetical protein
MQASTPLSGHTMDGAIRRIESAVPESDRQLAQILAWQLLSPHRFGKESVAQIQSTYATSSDIYLVARPVSIYQLLGSVINSCTEGKKKVYLGGCLELSKY